MKPLGPLTTYGVGGPAALFVEVESPADLEAVRRALRSATPPRPGLRDRTRLEPAGGRRRLRRGGASTSAPGFSELELPEPDAARRAVVRAGAALALPVLARRVAEAGWSGLSWAVGVPGSVGGAVRMNAGGHGSDMASCVRPLPLGGPASAPTAATDDVARLAYGYRASSVRGSELVVACRVRRRRRDPAEVERAEVAEIVRWRREHQPGGANAGLGLHQPAGRRRRPADRGGRAEGVPARHGARLGEARQLHPGRPGGRADDVTP